MEQTENTKNMVGENSLPAPLGPFVGHSTSTSAKLWIHWPPEVASDTPHKVTFSLHESEHGESIASKSLSLTAEMLWAGIVEFNGLHPNTTYFYRILSSTGQSALAETDNLKPSDLRFRTMPEDSDLKDRLAFLLLSCHNPEAGINKSDPRSDGFEVWSEIPNILKENPDVRFAILGGDQVYLDEAAKNIGQNSEKRMKAVLEAYRIHWGNSHYRRVLCSLPSYLMWDDHDIVDGWGSERKAFDGEAVTTPKADWQDWFETTKSAFWNFQACRNPDVFGCGMGGPFDSCFRIGNCAFILADLRSNRNYRLNQIWLDEQFEKVKSWVASAQGIDTLFFVSPVVFAHGDPKTEEAIGGFWPAVLAIVDWLRSAGKFLKLVSKWDKNIGDLRDDLDDAWFSKPNEKTASKVLNYFFELQNPKVGNGISTVILSGDIHTSGYSSIYSDDPAHGSCAIIPHIVSSPVSYSPFPWVGEAFYRSKTKTVRLSPDSPFKAQISHHFSQRCATVISLRRPEGSERQLKVKFYLEGFEEPTTIIFDLQRRSHRENLGWNSSSLGKLKSGAKPQAVEVTDARN